MASFGKLAKSIRWSEARTIMRCDFYILLTFGLLLSSANACEGFLPKGVFDVVAVRPALSETDNHDWKSKWPLVNHADFDASVSWIDGRVCRASILKLLPEPTLNVGERMLRDAQLGYAGTALSEGTPRNIGVEMRCNGGWKTSFTLVDHALIIVRHPDKEQYALLGKRLGPKAIKSIQKTLTNRGFSPGPADGIYGESTTQALRQYFATRGVHFSAGTPVLNEVQLTTLGVECSELIH